MVPARREFLKKVGWLTAAGGGVAATLEAGEHADGARRDADGVLVDTTLCIGCRLCEYACRKANGIEPGPVESYDDTSVFARPRRPDNDCFTVVDARTLPGGAKPVYAKLNCMHCEHPACASACIVGALRKRDNGAVTYDSWKCIGCRYCMVACPFQIPTYQYDDALTPQVRKCQFCFGRTSTAGAAPKPPACVEACPRQAMVFGKRRELLGLAHDRIARTPGRYVDHVYGEHEVGGTSWIYLSNVPFERIGFLELQHEAPPALTEKIQHAVFSPKLGMPPFILYGLLGAVMYVARPRKRNVEAHQAPDRSEESPGELRVHAREPALVLAGGGGAEAYGDGNGNGNGNGDAHGTATALARPPAGRITHAPDDNGNGHADAHQDEEPRPVDRRLLTPGVIFMLTLMAIGFAFGVYRFLFGIGASTNLDQHYPWGLWIAIDVASGVALAAGGFTSAFLTHILHRPTYHAIARPALLTAMLGYTFVVIGLQADLGRYWNVWRPMLPDSWQGNSVLFEVGMCVMCYLTVLYLEFAPIFCERLVKEDGRFPRLAALARFARPRLEKIMFLLVIAGCCLSCLHQSSLGNLMVIAPSKLHPLWWTPYSPLLFLLSAIAVGFPMVIWEGLFAGWSLKLKPEMSVFTPLARFIPFTLGVYLAVKIADMINRGTWVYLGDGSLQSICWMIEIGLGVVAPLVLLAIPSARRSPGLLFLAVTLIVAGVIFNRVNVFMIGYRPPFTDKSYIPSVGEFAVTIGLIATLMFVYRVIVTYFPVITQPRKAVGAA